MQDFLPESIAQITPAWLTEMLEPATPGLIVDDVTVTDDHLRDLCVNPLKLCAESSAAPIGHSPSLSGRTNYREERLSML